MIFFFNSDIFWHRKITFKVQFWYFLRPWRYVNSQKTAISFDNSWFLTQNLEKPSKLETQWPNWHYTHLHYYNCNADTLNLGAQRTILFWSDYSHHTNHAVHMHASKTKRNAYICRSCTNENNVVVRILANFS